LTSTAGGGLSWNTQDTAGKQFHPNADRGEPFLVTVFAAEATKVYLASSNRYDDPMPLIPSAIDLIGVPSNRGYVSDNTTVQKCVHADSTACVFNSTGAIPHFAPRPGATTSATTFFRAAASRIFSVDPTFARSRADGNGSASAPFAPRGFLRGLYAINDGSAFVAVASVDPCTVEILDASDNVITTIAMTRSGSDPDAPYSGWLGNTNGAGVNVNLQAGYRIRAQEDGATGIPSCTFAAWYQPASGALPGSVSDETILFGTNDFTY